MSSAPMASITSVTYSSMPVTRWLARSRAWLSLLVLVPIGAACLVSRPYATVDSWYDFGFEATGWTLFLGGVTMRWWATLYISGRKTDELICDGPYSICRNPIYWGTFLLTLAVAVLFESLTMTAAVIIVSAFYFFTTVYVEEANLQARHGSRFAEYCARVPRILPRLSVYRSPASVELRMDGVRAEFRRTLRYAWLPIVCHFVAHLRSQSWWPDWNDLP